VFPERARGKRSGTGCAARPSIKAMRPAVIGLADATAELKADAERLR
jgi:hypothetical protein